MPFDDDVELALQWSSSLFILPALTAWRWPNDVSVLVHVYEGPSRSNCCLYC
jgi:hypothetical protein